MGIVGGPLLLIGVYISLIALWKWPKWSLPLGWAFTVIAAGSTFVTSPPQYERYVAGVAAFSLLVETGIALVALALAKAIKRPNANRSIAVGIGTLVLLGNVAFYLWVYIPEGQYLNLRTNWVANRQANQMLEEYNQGRQVVLVARFDTNIQNSLIVQFLMTGKPYLNGEEDLPNLLTRVDLTKPTSFLVSPQRKDDLTQLIHFFPSGKTFKVYLDENKEFAFYLFRLDSVLKS